MKDRPGYSFANRANAAAAAKKALLDKHRPQLTQIDPFHAQRAEMREAEVIRVREERAAEKAAKRQAAADAAAEAEATEAALQLEQSKHEKSKAVSEAEAKAKRDAKYAARKARK